MGKFFALLRRLDIWDSALIVIVADHGNGETPELYVNSSPGAGANVRPGAPESRRGFPKDKARGIRLVLVKRAGSTGEMQVSETPVSVIDVPATIASELALPAAPAGVSMFRSDSTGGSVRKFLVFDYSEIKTNYVGPITVYTIEGHSWDDASRQVENVLTPP